MGSIAVGKNNFETRKSTMLKIDQKVAELQAAKRKLDKEVEEMRMKLQNMIENLTDWKDNQQKTKKMLGISLAVSLSSITLGIRSTLADNVRGISWPIAIGVGSAVCSLYYLKYLLSSFKRQSRQQFMQDLFLALITPVTVEPTRTLSLPRENKRFLSLSMPSDLFSLLVQENQNVVDEKPSL